MLQVGYLTQFGILLLVIGGGCLLNTYRTTKWYTNAEAADRRQFRRQQARRPEEEREEYYGRVEQEPSSASLRFCRVVGVAALAAGAGILIWSLL